MDDDSIPIIFAAIFIQMIALYDGHQRMNRMEAISAAQTSAQKVLSDHIRTQLENMQIFNAETKQAAVDATQQRSDSITERREQFGQLMELLHSQGFHYLVPVHRIPMRPIP